MMATSIGAPPMSSRLASGRDEQFLGGLDLRRQNDGLCSALDVELLEDRGHMRFDGRFGDAELIGNLLVSRPCDSIIRTRISCGVSEASRRAIALDSPLGAELGSKSGGVRRPPSRTWAIAPRIVSRELVFGIKPAVPNSMQWRMTARSSLPETTITGVD
jgi:hypothetical protein